MFIPVNQQWNIGVYSKLLVVSIKTISIISLITDSNLHVNPYSAIIALNIVFNRK